MYGSLNVLSSNKGMVMYKVLPKTEAKTQGSDVHNVLVKPHFLLPARQLRRKMKRKSAM